MSVQSIQGPKPRLLITRPAGQHEAFSTRCQRLGFDVSHLPTVRIEPVHVDVNSMQRQLDEHAMVLFTSANAVHHAHTRIPLPWPQNQVHAIGAATAHCLEQHGQNLALTPQPPYNTEQYLRQLGPLQPRSVLIIKGQGGRELLQHSLRAMQCRVAIVDVYRRVRPQIPPDRVNDIFLHHLPDIISITSNEILNNLWSMADSHHDALRTIPLIVNSERCALLAAQLGFSGPCIVAVPAGDDGQIQALEQWIDTRDNT